MNKLSEAQEKALRLIVGIWEHQRLWVSAYDIKASLATLNSLCKLGLIERKTTLGYEFFPRSCIAFRPVQKDKL